MSLEGLLFSLNSCLHRRISRPQGCRSLLHPLFIAIQTQMYLFELAWRVREAPAAQVQASLAIMSLTLILCLLPALAFKFTRASMASLQTRWPRQLLVQILLQVECFMSVPTLKAAQMMTCAMQGMLIPTLLDFGLTHGGLLGFIATSAGGSTLEDGCSMAEAEQARYALEMVHASDVLHCDVRSANLVRVPPSSGSKVWLLDFAERLHMPQLCKCLLDEELEELDWALDVR